MPAHTTAKIVMASAKRLIELRQPCLNSSRIAEISVPAWPMPIHQTKLMMAKPQATGCVIAQIPAPFRNSQVTATSSMVAPAPATLKIANQPSGVFGVSTIRAILSVTDLKGLPGLRSPGILRSRDPPTVRTRGFLVSGRSLPS